MSQILAALTYAAILGNLFLAALVSAAPADHPLPWWVVPLVAGGNAIIHALPSDGLPMPSKGAAKALGILTLGLFALALSACTTAQIQQAQADISTGIKAACTDVLAAQKLNPASPVANYATAACGTATAVAALVQNSATIQWLGQLWQQLQPPAAPAKA